MRINLKFFLVALALTVASVSAWAATGTLTIKGPAGQPVSGQTVTIEFPDGTETEEDTDELGVILIDDGPEGNYRVTYRDEQGRERTNVYPLVLSAVGAAAGASGMGKIPSASDRFDWSIFAGAGVVSYDLIDGFRQDAFNLADTDPGLTATGSSDTDAGLFEVGIGYDYNFSRSSIGARLRYRWSDNFSSAATVSGMGADLVGTAVMEMDGWQLGGHYEYSFTDTVYVLLEAGWMSFDVDESSLFDTVIGGTSTGTTVENRSRDVDGYYMATGLGLDLGERVFAEFSYNFAPDLGDSLSEEDFSDFSVLFGLKF